MNWLPISSAPKDGTRVLGAFGRLGDQAVGEMEFKRRRGEWHRPMQCGVAIEPTHWQPLPPPPEVES